ncbi:hypothetical protein MTR67_031890 [Solanum verrucosum]|uniref:Uncharacterized protein n=1 Tax=Solanum verrucosum TaxID=315347 RepID=A0AAF0U3C2_SOLVR|nr:hypothetical protein MTR67_031890 [Solanum verrucosum]
MELKLSYDWHEASNMETLFLESTIAELWTPHGWNFVFRRHLNDWEIPRVTKFFSTIDQFSGLKAGQDILQWQGNSNGTFKVNAAYRKMNQPSTKPADTSMALETNLESQNPTQSSLLCLKQWFIYLYTARSQVNYGDYSYVPKTYLGPCQGKSQKHYTVGKKQGVHTKNRNKWRIVPAAIWKERNLRIWELFLTSQASAGLCQHTLLTYLVAGSEGGSKTQKKRWKLVLKIDLIPFTK